MARVSAGARTSVSTPYSDLVGAHTSATDSHPTPELRPKRTVEAKCFLQPLFCLLLDLFTPLHRIFSGLCQEGAASLSLSHHHSSPSPWCLDGLDNQTHVCYLDPNCPDLQHEPSVFTSIRAVHLALLHF